MAHSSRRRLEDGHFSEEQWADFARRRRANDEEPVRMQQHLQAGCEPCAETLGFWAAVVDLAGREASYQAPDDVVARMKERFALHRPAGLLERAARSAALVFDSFRQPALAGIRAGGSSPRQMLYKAGRFAIRLEVDRDRDPGRVSVVGQIVDESAPQNALPDVPVLLTGGEGPVDWTVTNGLGEFQLESDPSDNLRLTIEVPEIGTLSLPGLLVASARRHAAGGAGTDDGDGRRTKARHA